MTDFSNIAALAVSEETLAEYTFVAIPGSPSIWFAPATDANRDFLTDRLRRRIEKADAPVKRGADRVKREAPADEQIKAQIAEIEDDREFDRRLIADMCAKRWGTAPTDVNGDQPAFSADNCYAFFKALPHFMFDPVRNFCSNPFNFIPTEVTADEAKRAGN